MLVEFLICFPLLAALLMFFVKPNKVKNVIAYLSAGLIIVAVLAFTCSWIMDGCKTYEMFYETEIVDKIILVYELALMCVVTYLCFKYKKGIISILTIVPTLMIAYVDIFGPKRAEIAHIKVDYMAILMCLIIGIIGSLIIIYAVDYMHNYHHHHHTEVKDRRGYFLMLLFVFMAAMFGFVLSDSLLWVDVFWETTSVCSFLLIGYTREKEAVDNSFRALWMNLLGGTALAVGIIYQIYMVGNDSFSALVAGGMAKDAFAVIPVALISFAALTKAAQMPFSKWLMGAMVAPTPSSALLHSATMVKAGIYVLFRLAPAMAGTVTGSMISFIGGFTFFMASLMAIAQSDGKKVLAFSTISNLGLMVSCAGVGKAETLWAGIFLMIFHAVSKSLLFQNIGTTENSTHSRDVEDMHGLLYRSPMLGAFMFIGIAGMFLAPFGMLISKWSALKACVDDKNVILVILICFGSATTMLYWTKWLSKLISFTNAPKIKPYAKFNTKLSLGVHAVMMIGLCVLFPLLSKIFVEPLINQSYGVSCTVLPAQILYALVILICLVFAIPFIAFTYKKNEKVDIKLSYMSGVNTGDNTTFTDSFGGEKELVLSNWYFKDFIGQRKLMVPCEIGAAAIIIVMLTIVIGGAI